MRTSAVRGASRFAATERPKRTAGLQTARRSRGAGLSGIIAVRMAPAYLASTPITAPHEWSACLPRYFFSLWS
ncbi:hypothetical protein P3T40_000684 [Paraburkholderia sp. EB58]